MKLNTQTLRDILRQVYEAGWEGDLDERDNICDGVLMTLKHLNSDDVKQKMYAKLWPNFCRKCNAVGGYRDEHGLYHSCSECVINSTCGRCGGFYSVPKYGYGKCGACGWTEGGSLFPTQG